MFPQTELDNYKLQVELLQEKLKRSEEQRKQLEVKFESIMRKRNEQEKIMKMKNRIKYQQFLEEQRERNDRNRALIKLLERVDQQAASLATRSERLKMMKLQYELYFAKLLQAQNMRSIQNSPRHYPTMPLNHIITNANLPIGIQDICQSSSNLSKSSPTIPETWGVMANNASAGRSNLPYRFPGNVDYFNGQILLSQDPLQRQVNLKSTFGDSMGPTHGYPAQIGTFADTRRNPIEFEHYKPSDLNIPSSYVENVNSMQTSRPDNHNRNLNEIQSLGKMNSESDFHGNVGHNGYPQRQVEIQRLPYQMSTSDKLSNIKQDGIHERMVAEVNKDDNKTDTVNEDDKKLQSINTIQRDIAPLDEVKQKTDESKENWTESAEKSMKKVQNLFSPDKLLINTNKINLDKPRTPVMWNFSGPIQPQDSNNPIQLGKKEKLTMENIENAIYGERINAINRKKDMTMEIQPKSPEKQYFLEKQEIKLNTPPKEEILKKDIDRIESHEEKTDISEKEEISAIKEEPAVVIPVKSEIPNQVSNVSVTPTDETQKPHELQTNTSTPEITSNQQYPQGYSQNYEDSFYMENSNAGEKSSTEDIQSAIYSNYEYNDVNSSGQPQADHQESPAKENPPTPEVSQETYPAAQYQSQDYQYQEYPQGQGYDAYQADQYQGEYDQQQYDPNAYSYNYEQGADGTYQQAGEIYQADGGNYPQGDGIYQQGGETYQQGDAGSYPQGDTTYQQGDVTYPAEGTYQQPDASYYQEGGGTYQQQNGIYQQAEGVYQDPNQQIYAESEYNTQPYTENVYPNDYTTGTEYSNYEEQKPQETNEQDLKDTSDQLQSNQGDQSDSNIAKESPTPQNHSENVNDKSEENVILPIPPVPAVMPPSILATEKSNDANGNKKKKKVNFVDSESEESSSAVPAPPKAEPTPQNNDESDFDFSSN